MTLTIHHGTDKPMHVTGKNQCNLLDFAFRNQGWHSFLYDRSTTRAVDALERKGYLKVARYAHDGQFSIAL
jgi:hypothetical protein